MELSISHFIKELQGSNEVRKRRWLFGLTIVTMSVIVTGWLLFAQKDFLKLNGTVPAEEEKNESSFVLFGRGLATVGVQFGRGFSHLGALLNSSLWGSTSVIVPEPKDFVLDALEPIPPKSIHGN